MNEREYQRIKNDVEEEAYLEWQMKQPGYWAHEIQVAALSAIVLLILYGLGYGLYKAIQAVL
jgi:hypothetical protein